MDTDKNFASHPDKPLQPIAPASAPALSDAELAADWAAANRDRQQRAAVAACAERGDYLAAIAILDELLARSPQRASDYNNRGLLHFKLGNHGYALADYDSALALNPRLDSAYNNRANCYAALGDRANAIADYQSALDFNPANLRAWINQALTYRDLGLYELALDNLDWVLVLGSSLQGRAYAERGRTYHLRGDWNSAIADYQRALSLLLQQRSARAYRQRVQGWLRELSTPLAA